MARMIFRRAVVDEIERYLHTDDVIVLHGARQVGKTSILMYLQDQLAAQGQRTTYLDLEDSRLVAVLDRGVEEFLRYLQEEGADLTAAKAGGKLFVLIDEVQYLANPSSFMKLIADHHRYLKLIVSGSSSFEMKSKFRDSLVGRTVDFEIYPLSFRELLAFREVPFTPSSTFTEKKTLELQALYVEYALYGGYPKIVLTPEVDMKERYLQQIIDTYVRKDIRDLAEIRDVTKFNRLLEALASQSGGLLNIAELSNTCALARPSVERYLFLLEQTYIIRLVRPFSRNLRSEISKMPKIYLCDTGLMQMLWLKRLQREVVGSVFETSIYAELLKRYGSQQVGYWRTADGREIDFVVRQPETTLLIEAKLTFPHGIPAALRAIHNAAETSTPGEVEDYRVVGLYGLPGEERTPVPERHLRLRPSAGEVQVSEAGWCSPGSSTLEWAKRAPATTRHGGCSHPHRCSLSLSRRGEFLPGPTAGFHRLDAAQQDSARRQLVARLEQDHLLLAPRLLVVEHQRQPAAQLQALGPLGDHTRGNLPLHLGRPHFAAQGERQIRLGTGAPRLVFAGQDGPRLGFDRVAGRSRDGRSPGPRCRGSPTCAAAPPRRSPTRPAPGRKRPGTTAGPWG